MSKYPPIHYNDYLGIDSLLGAQKLRSAELGRPAHDEMLFIITHQAYELWFRQILFEIDSVLELFAKKNIDAQAISLSVARLQRITEIQKTLLTQIDVLETMSPPDFLEFRDFLVPASGFQSFQFRMIETKLGLRMQDRLQFNSQPFYKALTPSQQELAKKSIEAPSLLDHIESWLERTPFLELEQYNFWQEYRRAVEEAFESDREIVRSASHLNEEAKSKTLASIDQSVQTFESLFDETKFAKLQKDNYFRLSQKAVQGALFIYLYRDEAILQKPYQLFNVLLDMDERWTAWRYRHALMAHRMLGRKIGTGGTSGHQYLREAADKHKIFGDFFNLSTFLIARSHLPELPQELKTKLGFVWDQEG